jgi:cobalt-precorrin 5A hydrolase
VFHVGIGCRRGKSKEEIREAVTSVFEQFNLALKSIKTIASIELKKDEPGILEFARELKVPTRFFSKDEIRQVQSNFSSSQFVESITKTTSVCEPCAHLCGGEMVVPKQIVNGITIAVTKEI